MLNRKWVTVYAKIKAKYSVTKEVEINLKAWRMDIIRPVCPQGWHCL